MAIYSLTSCEGCQFALLDLGERFLNFLKKVELVEFRLFEEEDERNKTYDIVFVEGSPITNENLRDLKKIRERAKILVVLGNCAALGGIPELKAYQNRKRNALCYVYKEPKKIDNLEIQEIDKIVKVDFAIPGCPINGEEFLNLAGDLVAGKIPKIPSRPVCFECQRNGNKCLLRLDGKRKLCLGPIVLGGCGAVCLNSKMPCWGCRGLLEKANINNYLKLVADKFSIEEFERALEIFGVRDDFCERYRGK